MGEKLARLPSKILDFVNNYEIQYWYKCGRSKMSISDAHLGQREAICLIFSHAFNFFFSRYPTKQQLLEISQLIIKTFPFLKDTSVGTGYVSLHKRISDIKNILPWIPRTVWKLLNRNYCLIIILNYDTVELW